MTLSPVFRDLEKLNMVIGALGEEDFADALAIQKSAVRRLYDDLPFIIDSSRLDPALSRELLPAEDSEFAQRYFFITLFDLILKNLGISRTRLNFYAELNYCIMGTTAAADNLFDREDKAFLPIARGGGSVYHSVLQLMCFERLVARIGSRAVADGILDEELFAEIQKGLLDKLAAIGSLEGSEESGVEDIPSPEEMVKKVHGVRGGMLFGLATVAPSILEDEVLYAELSSAAGAIRDLGTAFQIIDDITDFEFDLKRKSHNILVSQIHHLGTGAEKEALKKAIENPPETEDFVEKYATESGVRALEMAVGLIGGAIEKLCDLEFSLEKTMSRNLAVAFASTRGTPRLQTLADMLEE